MTDFRSAAPQYGWPILGDSSNAYQRLSGKIPGASHVLPSGVSQYHSGSHEFDRQASNFLHPPSTNRSSSQSMPTESGIIAEQTTSASVERDRPNTPRGIQIVREDNIQRQSSKIAQSTQNEGASFPIAWGINSAVRSKNNIPAAEWRLHREKIRNLYIDDRKTLEETRKMMEDDYGFVAS